MIQNIIVDELLKVFDTDKSSVCIETYQVSDYSFDLMDKLENSICTESKGNVTYKNKNGSPIYVFNYEKFIESLTTEKKKGIKHCDFVVTANDSFFICNELSMGSDIKSKWPKAWKQMQQTIKILNKSEVIKKEFPNIKCKYCVFSVRKKNICSPLGIADSFNAPAKLIKCVQERVWYPINQLGFKVLEADCVVYEKDGSLTFQQK